MIQRLLQWLKSRRTFNKTYRELSRLTNHELRDIGVDRTMITRISLETAYGYGDKL